MREVPSCWSEVYLPLQQPFLQQDQLSGPHIWTVWRLLPAKSSHHSVRVAHHQLTAPITVYRTDMHTMRSNSQDQYTRWTYSSEKAKWGFTDITDQDDFGVGRDVLGEKRLLVFRGCEFMLTGWIWFTRRGSCQVKEVKPALGSNSDHKVLSNGTKKKNTLYHQNFPDSLLQIIKHFITHPSFVADVSDCDAGQLGKQQIVRWVRETISLWVFSGFCTDHAHTGSCDPGFGVVILVHVQLSTCVPDNQLVQLQLNGERQQINFYIIWNKLLLNHCD